jgi:hypothetical protein
MDPITLGLLLGAAGVLKSEAIDRPAADRKRKAEAAKTRYSPWTGMQGSNVDDPDSVGSGMNWGMAGATLGQSMDQQQLAAGMAQKQGALLDSQIGLNNARAGAFAPSLYGDVTRKPSAGGSNPWNLGNDYSY